MASDYEDSKEGWGEVFPDNQVDTAWSGCGPLITPLEVRSQHLKGIPLYSGINDPVTERPDPVTDTDIKTFIKSAVSEVELEIGMDIFPRRYEERHPHDQCEMNSGGYMRLRHAPAASVEELAIVGSDGTTTWTIPRDRIETGYLHQGQLNIGQFAISSQGGSMPFASGAFGMAPNLFRLPWVPALWRVKYTTGFKYNKVPDIVNQLIGVVAAMEILSALATTFARTTSMSLGIDGLSESQSGPGADLFNTRLEYLGQKRAWMVKKLKHYVGLGIIVGNV